MSTKKGQDTASDTNKLSPIHRLALDFPNGLLRYFRTGIKGKKRDKIIGI